MPVFLGFMNNDVIYIAINAEQIVYENDIQ